MKTINILKYAAVIILLTVSAKTFTKEITDEFGKTVHTVKIDRKMVEFVRIKGERVLLYKDNNMKEPILTLTNKTFAQYMDREAKNIKVRVHDGSNASMEGWITRYQVYSSNDIMTMFYGEPFSGGDDAQNAQDDKLKDIPLNRIGWIVKDVTKLYYEPLPESDYKYEIYFGLRLEIKRQRGDYYFVQIYNSIIQEYRNGWVKTEDTGTFEYFSREYSKRRVILDKEVADIDIQITESETFVKNMGSELVKLEREKQNLEYRKKQLADKIDVIKAAKRDAMDEDQRRKFDRIANMSSTIVDLRKASEENDKLQNRLERDLLRYNTELQKNSEILENMLDNLEFAKAGKAIEEPVIETSAADEYEDEVKESFQAAVIPAEKTEEGKCSSVKSKLSSKMKEFEDIRSKMSGPINKDEYNRLYDEYMVAWNEIGKIKKELAECETADGSKHIELYNEAISLKKDEEYEDALELLIQAVEIKKDFTEGYYQIVSILITLEEDKEIDKYIDKISDDEKRGKSYLRRALSVKERYPKNAILNLQRMAEFYKPELAYYHIGLIYSEKYSDFESAVKFLKRSVEINYEDPKTLEALGAAYMEMKPAKGQDKNVYVKEALSYLEKAFRHAGDYKNIDILCVRLSQAYNASGKHEQALKSADTALQRTKQKLFGAAHLEKGKALIKLNRKDEARKHLNEAAKDISVKQEAEYWLKEM
jgi:tetratricopeptide (TPR) repeat protein